MQAQHLNNDWQTATTRFLGVRFNRMTQAEAVALLLDGALARESRRICFANAHTMNLCYKEPALRPALEACDLLLADGSGVLWGSRLCGKALTHNLNGTDLIPALSREGAEKGLSLYLLGAKPGVAQDAAVNLQAAYPGLKIAGHHHGYLEADKIDDILGEIRRSGAHVLLIAMGVPNQELWIAKYADRLPGITLIGVGGLFDFLAERVVRAPWLFRKTGMEWCWRMMMEPRRLWKRYLIGNVVFLTHLLRHGWSSEPGPVAVATGPNHPAKANRPTPAVGHSEFKTAAGMAGQRKSA